MKLVKKMLSQFVSDHFGINTWYRTTIALLVFPVIFLIGDATIGVKNEWITCGIAVLVFVTVYTGLLYPIWVKEQNDEEVNDEYMRFFLLYALLSFIPFTMFAIANQVVAPMECWADYIEWPWQSISGAAIWTVTAVWFGISMYISHLVNLEGPFIGNIPFVD